MTRPLVLSLFPGIGLLDMALEEAGFCVVRGPDLIWGGDVRGFHPPAGRFDGVIGGPPCQLYSDLKTLNPNAGRHGNMIPEFERVVGLAHPFWFLMENVPAAPSPIVPTYTVERIPLNNRSLGEAQSRGRVFHFGNGSRRRIGHLVAEQTLMVAENPTFETAVLAGHAGGAKDYERGIVARSWQEGARLQGCSDEWIGRVARDGPFTSVGLRKMIGNGVPLPMGRVIARAVRQAMYPDLAEAV